MCSYECVGTWAAKVEHPVCPGEAAQWAFRFMRFSVCMCVFVCERAHCSKLPRVRIVRCAEAKNIKHPRHAN